MENFYGQTGYGFYPQQAPTPPATNQLLNPEEIALLRQKAPQKQEFFTAMSPIDNLKTKCVHHDNGRGTIRHIGDGVYECTICGERFKPVEPGTDITQVMSDLKDIVESIKFYYGGIDPEAGKRIYPAFYVLSQIPQMWKVASDYAKSYAPQQAQPNMQGGYDGFNTIGMYSQVFSGNGMNPYMANPAGFQQPMMPQQYPAPMAPQYPAPQMQPQAPMYNQMPQQQPMPPMQQYPQQPAPAPQYAPAGMPQYRADQAQQFSGASNPIGGQVVENTAVAVPKPATATQNVTVATPENGETKTYVG